jgi:hypothetical protein
LSRVYAAETDGLCAYGIQQFASAPSGIFSKSAGSPDWQAV